MSKVDGKNTLVIYETSSTTGWKFIALVPATELYSTAVTIWIMNILIILVFVLISIGVTVYISKQISKPMEKIIAITHELANGNFIVKLPESNIKEVDELSCNFNVMIKKLKENT